MPRLITNRKIICPKCKKTEAHSKQIIGKGQLIYCGKCFEKLEMQRYGNIAIKELEEEFEKYLRKLKQSKKGVHLLPKGKKPNSQY